MLAKPISLHYQLGGLDFNNGRWSPCSITIVDLQCVEVLGDVIFYSLFYWTSYHFLLHSWIL